MKFSWGVSCSCLPSSRNFICFQVLFKCKVSCVMDSEPGFLLVTSWLLFCSNRNLLGWLTAKGYPKQLGCDFWTKRERKTREKPARHVGLLGKWSRELGTPHSLTPKSGERVQYHTDWASGSDVRSCGSNLPDQRDADEKRINFAKRHGGSYPSMLGRDLLFFWKSLWS